MREAGGGERAREGGRGALQSSAPLLPFLALANHTAASLFIDRPMSCMLPT